MPETDQADKPRSKLFTVAMLTLAAPCGSRPLLHATVGAWRAAAASRRKWRRIHIEDPGDEAPRPHLRTPADAHVPQDKHKRGVSPPPLDVSGWAEMGNGWQKHKRAPKWLRKSTGFGSPVYFYLPDDSLWMTMPNGLFMSVDECSGLLADTRACFNNSLLQMCFSSWRCQASVTRQWRYKISLFGVSAGDLSHAESHDAYASAEDCRFTSSDALLLASPDEHECTT